MIIAARSLSKSTNLGRVHERDVCEDHEGDHGSDTVVTYAEDGGGKILEVWVLFDSALWHLARCKVGVGRRACPPEKLGSSSAQRLSGLVGGGV